jgi:O-antigen/teichoic acid export membrane protein
MSLLFLKNLWYFFYYRIFIFHIRKRIVKCMINELNMIIYSIIIPVCISNLFSNIFSNSNKILIKSYSNRLLINDFFFTIHI